MVTGPSAKCLRQIRLASCLVFVVMAWASILSGGKALAAEDGKGFYLLGSTTSLAGIVPPPGMYGVSYKYIYSGSASGSAAISEALGQIGNITLQADIDVDADVFIDVLTPLWVLPTPVLGGNLALGALVPVGWQDVDVDIDALATLTLANGTVLSQGRRLRLGDDVTAFGDPVALAMLGWHRGNWHWKVAGMLNIPVGQYDKNNAANMGFNRWGFDANAAATWLDPTRGHEASVTAGFTFNDDNDDTDYKTGTEFHVEFALMQHFSQTFSAGLAGYHYQQVTGDSGAGATLGSFKGRVTALGPQINYNFQLGQLPVSTSLRYFHEFDVKNRLEGDAGYLVVTIPLGQPGS